VYTVQTVDRRVKFVCAFLGNYLTDFLCKDIFRITKTIPFHLFCEAYIIFNFALCLIKYLNILHQNKIGHFWIQSP
jgi:hypothetical protein